MKGLEPSDIHRLNAALGWLGLGSAKEARTELEAISKNQEFHPAVLEAWWLVCAQEENWKDALIVAEHEVKTAPNYYGGWLHRAYALRRVPEGSLSQAWNALLPAAKKFPTEPTIPYNLSCYACQLKDLDASRVWLKQAIKIGGKESITQMALADDDLKPLWPEIKEL